MVRLGTMLHFLPIPGLRAMPEASRIAFVVALGWIFGQNAPPIAISEISAVKFVAIVAAEAAIGLACGVVIGFTAETLVFAIQTIAMQAGFSYASTIDPNSDADSSVLQIFYQLFANFLFFTLGGDASILKAFAHHLDSDPLLQRSMDPASQIVIASGASMMQLGLRLAAPLAAFLLLCDLTLALLGRMHSQLQLLSMGFPIKMLSTLFLLSALGPAAVAIYHRALVQSGVAIAQLAK
jgi:flagellar biosynthesis protein FliR